MAIGDHRARASSCGPMSFAGQARPSLIDRQRTPPASNRSARRDRAPADRDVWSPTPTDRIPTAASGRRGSRGSVGGSRARRSAPTTPNRGPRAAVDEEAARLERLRAVASQVLRGGAGAPAARGGDDFMAMEALASISPVSAAAADASSWGAGSPAWQAWSARRSVDGGALLRRHLGLWRSATHSSRTSAHATGQRTMQEQLLKKDEELRATVGALERAVTVSQKQMALSQARFEAQLEVGKRERETLVTKCEKLSSKCRKLEAAVKPVVATEDPELTREKEALVADQRALAVDRAKLRKMQTSLSSVVKQKEAEHQPLTEALERVRRARVEDSTEYREVQRGHQQRLLSNFTSRVELSRLRACVAGWQAAAVKSRRRRVAGERIAVLVQRREVSRCMVAWMKLIHESRRVALSSADNELATALADLSAVRSQSTSAASPSPRKDTAAQEDAERARKLAAKATAEAETLRREYAAAQSELAAGLAEALAASAKYLGEREAHRRVALSKAMSSMRSRGVRSAFAAWNETVQAAVRTRRVIARFVGKLGRAALSQAFATWHQAWRTTTGDVADAVSFARAANQAAAETTIQLLEKQLRDSADVVVAAELQNEAVVLALEAEVAAAKSEAAAEVAAAKGEAAAASETADQVAERSTSGRAALLHELAVAQSALAQSETDYKMVGAEREGERADWEVELADVTRRLTKARDKITALKQEQQGLKLVAKLEKTGKQKAQEKAVKVLSAGIGHRVKRRLLREVVRGWVEECWRAQELRSEQLFSQLTLLAEAQSAAVEILEGEADDAVAAHSDVAVAKASVMKMAAASAAASKNAWGVRCVKLRVASQNAVTLRCTMGAWRYHTRVKAAKRAARASWSDREAELVTQCEHLAQELVGSKAQLEGMGLLGMPAGAVTPDELMELLLEAAEELASANALAKSEAERNDELVKQLASDSDRQVRSMASSSGESAQEMVAQARMEYAKKRVATTMTALTLQPATVDLVEEGLPPLNAIWKSE